MFESKFTHGDFCFIFTFRFEVIAAPTFPPWSKLVSAKVATGRCQCGNTVREGPRPAPFWKISPSRIHSAALEYTTEDERHLSPTSVVLITLLHITEVSSSGHLLSYCALLDGCTDWKNQSDDNRVRLLHQSTRTTPSIESNSPVRLAGPKCFLQYESIQMAKTHAIPY